ncbi:MAG: hypothetical protein ABI823_08070 [Bryobacteraceae bacterium]
MLLSVNPVTRRRLALSLLTFLLVFACSTQLAAQQALQKIRTFYSLDAPAVPAGLRETPVIPPIDGLSSLAKASDGATWVGSTRGAVRFDPTAAPDRRYQIFAGLRYLPDDEVLSLYPDSQRGMWVRTRSGVSHIELRPMTLLQKADHFEDRILRRHDRYGMVADSHLLTPGDLSTNTLTSSDNDGLWTAMYGAAECFRYAQTHSPKALALAKKSIEAVLFLEKITGIPGFPARSYVKKGEPRPKDGVWHWTPDGEIQWKGDTSSDEIVGHFFLFSVAWDTLDDPQIKKQISDTARRIMDYILANGYNLIDVTGKPTYWGEWTPTYFASKRGYADAPLNAAELMSFLKTTHHITKDPKYDREYRKVAFDMGYAEMATRELERREELNYSDEELAYLAFYPLFRYEKDPKLLDSIRRAAGDWWQNMQREQNPLWIYIHALGQPAPIAQFGKKYFPQARNTLERIPMDLIKWTIKNSGRPDIVFDTKVDRFDKRQVLTFLPPDERPVMKWNGNPFVIDGGHGGTSEDDGAAFLLPYWMGRHFGFLTDK